MIVVVDYGMGNLGSIANMLRKVGAASVVSSDPAVIEAAEKLILPGVGAFDYGMRRLAQTGLQSLLTWKVMEAHTPVLGLCLGMQLFARRSEEGGAAGLGWLSADVVRFKFGASAGSPRVPHMGWNTLHPRRGHPLLVGMDAATRFYFVHSYHLECADPELALADTEYGYEFTSVVASGNVVGVQFHPEKSHRFGMRLFEAFAAWHPAAG